MSDTSDNDDIADTNGNESQITLTPRQFSREGLKVFCLNINSLLKHFDQLRIFIEQKKPHVVCLNETKIDGTIDNEVIEIDDYQLLRNIVQGMGVELLCICIDQLVHFT